MASDGQILIDTRIDTSGIEEGMQSLGSEMKKNTADIEQIGEDFGEEFSEGFEKGIGDMSSSVLNETADMQEQLNKMSGSMINAGNTMTDAVTRPLLDIGARMIESAAEMNAASSQFSQVFGSLESDASASLAQIANDTNIVEERLKGSYTAIASFAKTTGMETEEAMELSNRALVAVADSAAFYDRSIEETAESLQSFLKGNYENDAALGLSATEFTRNAAAMELYGVKFNELSEAQKQLTLLKMVEDANALSGAYGQAARESETWSNVTGNLNQEFENLLGLFGENLLPVVTPLVEILTDILKGFNKLSPGTQKFILIIAGVVTALGPLLTIAGSVISIITTLSPLISGLSLSFSPVVLAIGAAIVALTLLIANWDTVMMAMTAFDDFLQNVFATNFTEIFGPVLGEVLNAFFLNIEEIWKSIKQIFNGIINFVKGVFTGDWKKAWNGIKDIFAGVFNAFEALAKAPLNLVIGAINGLINGVEQGLNGIINMINSFDFEIPEWVPVFGGKKFDINIPMIKAPRIPYLATDAVIPPNAPFLAMLGDQRHGNNIEAPEDLIRKIVREETSGVSELIPYLEEIIRYTRETAEKELGVSIDGRELVSAYDARKERNGFAFY